MPTKRAGLLRGLFFILTAGFQLNNVNAQTLFSYGNHAVDRAEFLKAFSRNNADVAPGEKSYREYLSLYIRFKLKVQAALDARLDTSAQQKEELANFRSQILERYMTDEKAMSALVQEAMERSRKELLLYHLFLAIPSNASEEEVKRVTEKAEQLYGQLSRGEDFQRLAVMHSQDPEVVRNKGRVGYISAFVLPYAVENIVYNLSEGAVSRPYRSNIGIHLFKNGGTKVVEGQLKIAHILIAFPPDADLNQEENARKLADSLYAELKKGADFKDLAFRYSKDNITYLSGGEISDFGTGLYDPAFEDAARLLAFDSAISVPVKTSYGYHIIRRLGLEKAVSDTGNISYKEKIRQRVMDDDRNDYAKASFIKNILQQVGFKKFNYPVSLFNKISDSVLKGDSVRLTPSLSRTTALFSFSSDKTYTFGDWLVYLQALKENGTPVPVKGVEELYSQYADNAATVYYGEHLERYNKEFAAQLNEFREGNLLFEIMQKKIWDVAAEDTAGLRKYYIANAAKYWWSSSADVVVFTTSDEAIAEQMRRQVPSESFDWRRFVQEYNGSLQADSGRFELDQLPVPEGTKLMPATFTAPMRNEIDNNLVFCLVLRMHPDKEPRNFSDARGFVINDYQNFLEDQWINNLRKKYPVKINEAVLRSLPQGEIK